MVRLPEEKCIPTYSCAQEHHRKWVPSSTVGSRAYLRIFTEEVSCMCRASQSMREAEISAQSVKEAWKTWWVYWASWKRVCISQAKIGISDASDRYQCTSRFYEVLNSIVHKSTFKSPLTFLYEDRNNIYCKVQPTWKWINNIVHRK